MVDGAGPRATRLEMSAVIYAATPREFFPILFIFTLIQPSAMPRTGVKIDPRFPNEARRARSIGDSKISFTKRVVDRATLVVAVLRSERLCLSVHFLLPAYPVLFIRHHMGVT
jgi:hypothetical protein